MSKKDKLAKAFKLPQQGTQILDSTEVKSSVNLNLNQTDLIDMAVQEKLEELEKTIVDLYNQRKLTKDIFDKNVTVLLDKVFASKLMGSKLAKLYLNAIQMVKPNALPVIKLQHDLIINWGDTPGLTKYIRVDFQNISEIEDIFSHHYHKNNIHRSEHKMRKINIVTMEFKEIIKDGEHRSIRDGIDAAISIKRDEHSELFNKWDKEILSAINPLLHIEHLFNEAVKQYFEFKQSKGKVRARMTRLALSKSPEGQKILDLLAQNKTKLLE